MRRFSAEEKAAFVVGAAIEWLNSSQWRPARVTGPQAIDEIGERYYPIEYSGPTTRTISHGESLRGYKRGIRVRAGQER